jgi:DNA-binding LacI/PurR family transcriptional regulator
MLQFDREKILPLFLRLDTTISDIAARAGVAHITCKRAINGDRVIGRAVNRVARALGIDATEYLLAPAAQKGSESQ